MAQRHTDVQLQNTWAVFQQTYLLVYRMYEMTTMRFGLSHSQATMLSLLRAADRPLPLSQVARLLLQESSSTTEMAYRLQQRGLVERSAHPRDRRMVLLNLTQEGRDLIDAVLPALADTAGQIYTSLSPREVVRFSTLLKRVRDQAAAGVGVDVDQLALAPHPPS